MDPAYAWTSPDVRDNIMSHAFAGSNFWLLRLVLPGRWGRWFTGTIIFVVFLCLFAFFGQIFGDAASPRVAPGVVVFFCIILAYIIPVHHLIVERSMQALIQLTPAFPDGDVMLTRHQQRVLRKPGYWYAATLIIGAAAGITHNAFLFLGADLSIVLTGSASLLSLAVTVIVWIIMTTVIASLVDNALLFNRLAERIKVDVLNVRTLTPFGSVAVSSTLAMIGAQAAFPALMVESDAQWITFAPGLLATGVPMIFLFLLPIMPVHRRIVAAKRTALDRVNGDIAQTAGARNGPHETAYGNLQPLLIYRSEISAVSEWPFDTSVMGRLAFYLIIPPLTWIGAALIEILVDTAI